MASSAKKPAARRTAAKKTARRTAAKKTARQKEPEIQVNRTPTEITESTEQGASVDELKKAADSRLESRQDDGYDELKKGTDPKLESHQDDGYDDDPGEDAYDPQETREAELEEVQRVHAERTGGGDVRWGELQEQREEHNSRVGGA